MMRFLILLLLLMASVRADESGLMQPYSQPGTFAIAQGKARVVIEKDDPGRFQCQIFRKIKDGEQQGGYRDFIKNSSFFIFPQDAGHYWIYDGQSDIILLEFWDGGVKATSLSCKPEIFREMPSEASGLLPLAVRQKIQAE